MYLKVVKTLTKSEPEIDKSIIEGCRKGKLKYQELLYKQFFGYGMSIALRYAYSRDEALEILNDSFLKVFDNIGKFEDSLSFKAWFRRIVINTSIDYFRKNKKHHFGLDLDVAEGELEDYNIINELNVESIMDLLNSLPEDYRITFNLYEIEGYSHEEIANMLGVATGTSRSNLTRAKKLLRQSFQQKFQESYARVI